MPAWNGRETADITYEDHETANTQTTYKLTKLLCEYGYLPNDLILEHQGASLNYYLEVKTTTLGCGTRLFVSKAQYQRVSQPSPLPFPTLSARRLKYRHKNIQLTAWYRCTK